MIVTKIQGGLGNQFFKYAIGRHLSHKLDVPLKMDLTHYTNTDSIRTYRLNKFNIKAEPATKKDLSRFSITHREDTSLMSRLTRKLKKPLQNRKYLPRRSFVEEKNNMHSIYSDIFKISDNTYIDGGWQSHKYFEDISSIIKSDLSLTKSHSPTAKKILAKVKKGPSTSLHVRRGDFVDEDRFHQLSQTNYYENSVRYIESTIGNFTLFVFSDDIHWVKKKLTFPQKSVFVSDKDISVSEELSIMSKCNHNITANSTFSWWGAWLNEHKKKIVITPKKWFREKKKPENQIPSEWIKMDL